MSDKVVLTEEASKDLFMFEGRQYTRDEFMVDQELEESEVDAIIQVLKDQGHIVFIHETAKTNANRLIEKAKKQAKVLQAGIDIEEDQELEDIRNKAKKRENRHTYEKVVFEFPNMEQAEGFVHSVQNLRLECALDIGKNGDYEIKVFDLTDKELGNLTLIYKTNQTVRTTVKNVDKAISGAVKATDYTAKKIFAPIAKIGLSGVLGIGKSVLSTGAKIGGTTLTETIRATKSTCETISQDESIRVAKAEIYKVGNELRGHLNKNKGVSGNGIRIE